MLTTYIEAEYADGYIHREDEADTSHYEPGRNIFYDIVNKLPERIHGRMIRLTLFHNNKRYDVDWTKVADNARPVRYKNMFAHFVNGATEATPQMASIGFGYQWNDPDGSNQQDIIELDA